MRHVRSGQHHFTMRAHRRGLAEVDDRRLQEPEPTVMMVVVVLAKERLAERAAIFDRSEAVWKLWAIFERPELRFRKRIVVGDVRPTVSFRHAQVREQQRHGLAPHRGAAVRMEGQVPRRTATLQRFGKPIIRRAKRNTARFCYTLSGRTS
jgi:hypothetical protein